MSAITKANFYNLLKQAVMFSPAGAGKCSQLQTFRVLEQGAGRLLQSENFGATVCDREKPFFWSRAWHNAKYNPNKVIFDFCIGRNRNRLHYKQAAIKPAKKDVQYEPSGSG